MSFAAWASPPLRTTATAPDAGSKLLDDLLALSERPEFAGKFRRVTLNPGEVLLNQGAESREMFVLISGAMRAGVPPPRRS